VAPRLADFVLRRPWAPLVATLTVLAGTTVIAVGAPDHLGIGSLGLDDHGLSAQPVRSADLVIETTGSTPVRSGVYRVALGVISSQVHSDADVTRLRRGQISANGRSVSLLVDLAPGGDTERQQAIQRIESRLDPGPLHVTFGGEIADLLRARGVLAHDLWKLELLMVPFVALVLVGALGPLPALAPIICAATAVTGSLAGLRIVDAFANVSLLGIAPAAVLGVTLGTEAACLVTARVREEEVTSGGRAGLTRAIGGIGATWVPLGAAAIAATAGLLATGLHQAPSMVLGCALAALFALGSALLAGPALLVLIGSRASEADGEIAGEPRLSGPSRLIAGVLAARGWRVGTALAAAVALMVAAAAPTLHGTSRPFAAVDLGPGSGSLFGDLPLAAAVSAVALAVVIVAAFRSVRLALVAPLSLLPAGAACGLAVLVFQDGHLTAAIAQGRQGALETGAVASLLAALAAVSAGRAATAIRASRGERELSLGPVAAAEGAAAFTFPAAAVATLIGAVAAGVLAGADLYSAREFGLAVALGLLFDLLLLRGPLIAALSRWGGGGVAERQ
jgi:MMPL family